MFHLFNKIFLSSDEKAYVPIVHGQNSVLLFHMISCFRTLTAQELTCLLMALSSRLLWEMRFYKAGGN